MRYFSFIYLASAILLFGCATGMQSTLEKTAKQIPAERWINANADNISETEITILQNKALMGDGATALRLSNHYAFGPIYDPAKADLWETIALENGYDNAIYLQACNFMHSSNPLARVRAHYWFERLKNNPTYGKNAKNYLKMMDADE